MRIGKKKFLNIQFFFWNSCIRINQYTVPSYLADAEATTGGNEF